jgi:enterochelin esterase-like enzyme
MVRLYFLSASIVVALICTSATAWAQVGPCDVTFDVTLPANTPAGDSIYVAGDFQNWDPGANALTRDSATHAHGTITTTQGTAIQFKFTRGDWARVERALDCSDIPNRTATATGSSMTVTVTVENWGDICVAVYDKRAQKVHFDNTVLGVPKEFYIYTPADYSLRPGLSYPVVYLFRGHETEWINKNQDSNRGGKNVIDVYEGLRASGQVGPMILVFPGISSDDDSVSGMVTNFKAPELTSAPGIGNGRFEDYLLQDVMGYVDTHYRAVAAKGGRGVDGFSLGGFMSAKIAAQHPELFRSAGVFDGTHFYSRIDCSMVDLADQTFLDAMFDPVFGNPRDTAYAALNNGPSLVCNSTPELMQSIHWFVQYGPLSREPNDSNYLRGDHLASKLAAQGVTNEITPVLDGGHNWGTADQHMQQTLPLHWSALKPAVLPELRVTSMSRRSGGAFHIEGTGVPLATHKVLATDSLSASFVPIDTVVADADGKLSFDDQNAATHQQRFYRFAYP